MELPRWRRKDAAKSTEEAERALATEDDLAPVKPGEPLDSNALHVAAYRVDKAAEAGQNGAGPDPSDDVIGQFLSTTIFAPGADLGMLAYGIRVGIEAARLQANYRPTPPKEDRND